MASAVTVQKLTANVKLKMFDFDPDATTKTVVGWEDMRDWETFMAVFMRTIGTSAVADVAIQAASDSSGTGAIDVVTKTISSEPDALSDQIVIECDAAQVAEILTAGRWVSMTLSFATNTDEGVVSYLFGGAKFGKADRTVDIIA